MSDKKKVDDIEEEDGWYSQLHYNHVGKTKKESIISEVLGKNQ